jgi:DNA-directed RNA polymerase subunit A'
MIVQLHYGEDGIDPTRSVHGDAVDIDDILSEVLGDEADLLARIEEKKQAGYATVEKDLMETMEEEEMEEPEYDTGAGGED